MAKRERVELRVQMQALEEQVAALRSENDALLAAVREQRAAYREMNDELIRLHDELEQRIRERAQ